MRALLVVGVDANDQNLIQKAALYNAFTGTLETCNENIGLLTQQPIKHLMELRPNKQPEALSHAQAINDTNHLRDGAILCAFFRSIAECRGRYAPKACTEF